MQRPIFEVANVIELFGKDFEKLHHPNSFTLRILNALQKCRTSSLGGHKEKCESCGKERISYNSCKNRHCPKCQASKQAFWVEDRAERALDVNHFHIVFTIPDKLNEICLLDSNWFYNCMFECVWDTLRTFGYSQFGTECGAICVMHTWGQQMIFHPHIHCIVPDAGLTLTNKLKRISKNQRFLFPVRMLSIAFRAKFLTKVKSRLKKIGLLSSYSTLLNQMWLKPWNVYCKPSLGNSVQIVKYLGQYTHRIAISNHRILNIDNSGVTFSYKDYADNSKQKIIKLSGTEFLRRFCMHILPFRFVKIRYYGIYSSKSIVLSRKIELLKDKPKESTKDRIARLTGFDICICPFCKTGNMVVIEIIPRIRSPNNFLKSNTSFSD